MKVVMATIVLALGGTAADAQTLTRHFPSCDLPAQRALKGQTGGRIKDAGQAHISMRANILQADIGTARKARRLSRADADRLSKRVDVVRRGTDTYTRQQGFLGAGELASYDRGLDAVATRLCRTRP